MPKKISQKILSDKNNVFSGDNTFSGNNSFTGTNTYTGSNVHQGEQTFTDTAGTGAGVIKTVQAQGLTVKTTLPTTTGAAGGSLAVTGAAGAAGATTTAGGAGAAATVTAGAGGAKAGTGAAVGGAGGAAGLVAGAGGDTASSGSDAAGAGGSASVTAGTGGNATAGTGNGGAGGNVILTAGTGGTTTGGTAGVNGMIFNRSVQTRKQGNPTAEIGVATITIADMLTGIITISHSTGGTVALTTDVGTAITAGLPSAFAAGDSFDFTIINLSAAAADTATLTAGISGVTLVGAVEIPSAHATTIVNSSMTFRLRKTGADTYIIYRVG